MNAGLDALRAHPDVDSARVGMMGFSRGALLTVQSVVERPGDIGAAIVCAPASGMGMLEQILGDVSGVRASVHIMVAENDQQENRGMVTDHVALGRSVESALRGAGKEVEMTVYPPFGDDGHRFFFEVREPYWSDAVAFFTEHL